MITLSHYAGFLKSVMFIDLEILMKIKGIVWLGTRTAQFEQMTNFCRDVMGLSQTFLEPGFAIFDLPNGDRLEVFGPQQPYNTFMTHPVAGFLVDDIEAARRDGSQRDRVHWTDRVRWRRLQMEPLPRARWICLRADLFDNTSICCGIIINTPHSLSTLQKRHHLFMDLFGLQRASVT